MPEAPSPITSPPRVDGQPWDATSKAPVAGWKSVDGEAGTSGDHFAGLPDAGEGGWEQTLSIVSVFPPGQEIAHAGNADQAHTGNVVGVRVKVPGSEQSRVWPDGTLPGMPGPEPSVPSASFTWSPPSPGRNTNVTLNGSGSSPGDPDYPVTGYDWTFSDGTADKPGMVVTWRTPNKSGSYTVTLTVTDGLGQPSDPAAQVFTF